MKTKYKRFGKRTLSVLLSLLMLVSSMMIGSIATIDASADIIITDGSNTSVSLAGSMNNWSSTAWPLTYQGSDTHYSGTFYMPYSPNNYEAKVVVGSKWYTKVSSSGSAYWVTTSSGSLFNNRWGGLVDNGKNFQIPCISAASGYIKAEVHFYGKDPSWGDNNSFYLTQTAVSALSTTINNVSNNAEYDIGDTITLQSSATGGSGSYSHTYTVTRDGTDVTPSVITNNNVFTAPTVGTSTTYRITDTVSDANSQLSGLASATSYVDVVVKPAAVNYTGLSVIAQKSDNNSAWDDTNEITTNITDTEGRPTVSYTGSLTGYEFAGWYSASGSFADANSASTTFNPTAHNSVAIARFLKTYSISSSQSGATGTVSVASNAKVGDSVTATITPPENYSVSSVTVKDASGGTVLTTNDGNDYTFTMPASNVNILVTYEETARYYLVGEIFTSIDGTKTGNWNGVNDFGMKYDSKSGDYYVDVIFTKKGDGFKIYDNNVLGEKYYGGADGRCTLTASDTPRSTESDGEKRCVYNSNGTPNLQFHNSNAINEKYRVFYSTSLLSGHGNDSAIGTVYIKPLHTVTITDTKDNSTVTKYSANGSALSFTATKNGTQIPYATYKGNTVLMAETETAGTYSATITTGTTDETVTINYREPSQFKVVSLIDRTSVGASNGAFADDDRVQNITEGTAVTFTATPNEGYEPVWSFNNDNYDILSGDKNSNTIRILPKDNLTVYVTFREKNSISKTAYTGNGAYLFSYTTKPDSSSALSNGSAVNLYTDNEGNLFACLTSGDDNDYTNDVIKQGQIHYIAYASTNNASRTVDLLSANTNPSYAASSAASTALNGIGFEGNHCGGDVEYKWLKIKPKNSGDTILVYIGKVNNNAVTFGSDKSGERKSFYLDAISGDPGTVSNSTTVYAKTGMIRKDVDYDKYSYYSDIYVTYENGAEVKYTGSESYVSDLKTHYKLKTCTVLQNRPLTVTVKIHDDYAKQLYYVKGFNVNIGDKCYTMGVISEPDVENDGEYSFTFTPTSNAKIEITPIYYYNTKHQDAPKCIKLKVENFDESVQAVWGNTIAVHTWYNGGSEEYKNTPATSNQNALGGYPGQPLIKEPTCYAAQIPLTNNAGEAIKGVLLNNFKWDKVHYNLTSKENAQSYDFDDFLALSMLDDVDSITFNFKYHTDNAIRDNGNSGNFNGSNVQEVINSTTAVNLDDNTKFSTYGYKYGSQQYEWNALVDYNDIPIDLFGNRLEVSSEDQAFVNSINENSSADDKTKAALLSNNINYVNFDHKYYNEKYVLDYIGNTSETLSEKFYIVSNGYINYYDTSSLNPLGGDAASYLGEYATMWCVYEKKDDNKYDLIGYLPPSAFITKSDYRTKYRVGADGKIPTNTQVPAEFLDYTATAWNTNGVPTAYSMGDTAREAMWAQFVTIYNKTAGHPMQIKYEASIYDDGEDGAVKNSGHRADGRWYFSRSTSALPVTADIQICILDNTNGTEQKHKYIKKNLDGTTDYLLGDSFVGNGNTGTVTTAKAHFTNDSPYDIVTKETFNNKTSATVNYSANESDKFTFTASKIVSGKAYSVNDDGTVSANSTDQKYEFVGWYTTSGGALNHMSDDISYYADMSANITLVAVYRPYEEQDLTGSQKQLTVYHDLYAKKTEYNSAIETRASDPAITNGRQGNTNVSIRIAKTDGTEIFKTGTTLVQIDPTELNDNDNITITLSTTLTDEKTKVYVNDNTPAVYYYDSTVTGEQTHFKTPSNVSGSKYTFDTSNTRTGVTTYTGTVSEIFGEDSSKTLYFFTNLFSSNITVTVRYYDRDISHNKPVDMRETATTVPVPSEITESSTINDLNLSSFDVTQNEMDTYTLWVTQSNAMGDGGIKSLPYYDDNGNKTTYGAEFTDANEVKIKYHTNRYGKPTYNESDPTKNQKWATYYDANGNELANNDALTKESTLENVGSIVLWMYNKPKEYTFKAYYTPEGQTKPTLTKIDGTDLYYDAYETLGSFKDKDGNTIFENGQQKTMLTGFYNQRLGLSDGREGATTNGGTDYLSGYGINSPFFGGIDGGVDVTAIGTATGSDNTNLVFDGWYTKGDDGKFTLLCTDRSYQNRITNNLEIYALYRPKTKTVDGNTETTTGTPVSVSISEVEMDKYVDTNGVSMVRVNTQLNVTGEDVEESDKNIRYVSSIYYSLPNEVNGIEINWSDETNQAALANNAALIRNYVVNHMEVLEGTGSFNVSAGEGTITVPEVAPNRYHTYTTKMKKQDGNNERPLYTVTVTVDSVVLNPAGIVDCFTYKVVEGDAANNYQIDLTNKNRVQFTLLMTEEKYESSEFVAFVAIKYYDPKNTSEENNNGWYVSDNCISFADGDVKTYDALSTNSGYN